GDGSVVITPAAAGVGCPPVLNVHKVVTNTSNGPFTIQVTCTRTIETPAQITAQLTETTVDHVNLKYRSDGSPDTTSTPTGWVSSGGSWQLAQDSLAGSTCTATETDNAGATSVSYACSWTAGTSDSVEGVGCPGASSGPMATPASVVFEGGGD